jgi:hypothetical protein
MIAVVFVVDSSVALAAEWPALLPSYIMPMLRRLGEGHAQGTKVLTSPNKSRSLGLIYF